MEEEVVQDSVEDEVATQEYEADDSTQVEEEQSEEQSQPAPEPEESYQEKNFKALRQRQKEIEEDLKRKDEFIAQLMQAQKKPEPAQVVEEEQIDLEEYANYNGVQKMAKKTVQPLEQKIEQLEAMLAKQEQEKKISEFKSKYPDFDDVVNVETLELLEKKEPELAFDISQLKDPFKMGFQSYKLIKALGLAEKVPDARRVKEIDKKIEKNSKAVQSPQAYDKRPMAKAFKTTEADSKRLYEEMMHYASQAQGL